LQEEHERIRFVVFLTAQAALKDVGVAILLEYVGFIRHLVIGEVLFRACERCEKPCDRYRESSAELEQSY